VCPGGESTHFRGVRINMSLQGPRPLRIDGTQVPPCVENGQAHSPEPLEGGSRPARNKHQRRAVQIHNSTSHCYGICW